MAQSEVDTFLSIVKNAEQTHQTNIEAGWWTIDDDGQYEPKEVLIKVCLVSTELSEAFEGRRKDSMDDKLQQYKQEIVELADAAIRIGDLIGMLTQPSTEEFISIISSARQESIIEEVSRMEDYRSDHDLTAAGFFKRCNRSLLYFTADEQGEMDWFGLLEGLMITLEDVILWASALHPETPLLEVIEAKAAYNKTRADHKIENREKAGGKRF